MKNTPVGKKIIKHLHILSNIGTKAILRRNNKRRVNANYTVNTTFILGQYKHNAPVHIVSKISQQAKKVDLLYSRDKFSFSVDLLLTQVCSTYYAPSITPLF